MEVSLLAESNEIIMKSVPVSKSSYLPIISNTDELVLAKEEKSKCEHFTIRGYVSEVRKRDVKICWPLFSNSDSTSEGGHVNKLPLLPVKNFRRWDCQSCLVDAIPPETAIPNGTTKTYQNDEVKNDTSVHGDTSKESCCEATKSLPTLIRISNATCFPLSFSDKRVAASGASDLIKEGGYYRSKKIRNLMHRSTSVAAEKETSQIGGKGEGNMVGKATSDTALLAKKTDKSGISDKKQNQWFSGPDKRKVSGPEVCGMPQNSDALPSRLAFSSCYGLNDLVMGGDRASDTTVPLIENKSHPKKARKVRFLDEIIRSDDLQKGDRNCVSSGDAGSSGSGSIRSQDASPKQNDEHPSSLKTKKDEEPNKSPSVTQDIEEVALKTKNRKEPIPGNGEGSCLIHWLKKAPKRTNTSKFAAVKDLDLNIECFGRRENKKEIIVEKTGKCEAVKSSFLTDNDVLTKKGHIITEDQQIKNSHSKPSVIKLSENYEHHKVEAQGNVHRRDPLGIKKRKRLVYENGASIQLHRLKDQTGIEVQREIKKKQRTIQTSEQVAVDDIPMEIVELLAKKQQERHLMNIKDNRVVTQLPEVTLSAKDGNNCNITGYNSWTSDKNNGNAECRSKAYPSSNRSMQYHDIDLNQEAPICTPSDLQERPRYIGLSMSGAHLSIFHSNNSNNSPQNFGTNGTKLITFCSDQKDRTISSQNLFSHAHDGSNVILNGYPSGINVQKVQSDFSSNSKCLGMNLASINPTRDKAQSSNSQETFSNMKRPVEMQSNETMSALNLLRLMQQSAASVDPCNSSVHNDPNGHIRAFNGFNNEYPWLIHGSNHESHLAKPLRPLPRIGVLGPMLQKEIANTSNSSTPSLGFGVGNYSNIPFQRMNFVPRDSNKSTSLTFEKERAESSSHATVLKVMTPNKSSARIDSSSGLVMARSRDGAFQPIRSPEKLGECVLNRNPADFAMPDEDSEYMIGYQERQTRDMPNFRSPLHQTHQSRQKGKKVNKSNHLKQSTTSIRSSLVSRLSCPQNAK